MVRGQDGGVAVLVNRCMHRGTMLCPADRGSVRTFACPYHGWTYDLAGELLGVPYPGGYASFDKRAHGLARAPRVASYRGLRVRQPERDWPGAGRAPGRRHAAHRPLVRPGRRRRGSADGRVRMSGKKVVLVNAAEPLPNLSFLI
jgi:nitrite reductase/ring-hydroxylating ferredoxin subunit